MLKTVSTQLALASDTLSEILAKGNTSGPNDIIMDAGYGINGTLGATTPASVVATTGTFSPSTGDTPLSIITTTSGVFASFKDGGTTAGRTPLVGAIGDDLVLYTSAGSYSEKLRITAAGEATFSGNVVLASGKGIDFSATAGTGTSELLDDYEEGTWTPNISDAVTGGNVGGGFYDGRYTKVGNLVYVTGYMINGTTAGMTSGNDLYIQGLPFTSINESSLAVSGSVTTSAVTTTGNLTTNLLNNVTAFRISESVSGATEDYLEVSNLSTGNSDLFFTFSYRAA